MTLFLSACVLHFLPNTASIRTVCPITPIWTTKDAGSFCTRIVPDTSLDRYTLLLLVDHCTQFQGRMPACIPIFREEYSHIYVD